MTTPHQDKSHVRAIDHLIQSLAVLVALLVPIGPASAGLSADWHFTSAHPTWNSLNDIWAESGESVYAAGDGGVICHWNGSSWTEMETPTERPLFSIHGTSGNNIWAVGGDSYQSDNDDNSVVLHYDGSTWKKMPTPVDGAGQRLTLSDVWVQSPGEVWAIVESYLSLFKWDGNRWETIDFQGQISGVTVEGNMKDLQWVEGLGLFMVGTHGQVVHFDGNDWTLEQKLEEGNSSTSILTTIHAVDAGHIYAGHNWGTVYQRNPDGSWTDLELGEGGFFGSGQILEIRGNAADDLYLFTDRKIRHFTGSAPTANTDYGRLSRGNWKAADAAEDQIFIVDSQGGVFQFDSSTAILSPLSAGSGTYFNGRMNGATADGANELLIFGDGQYYSDPAMALATSDGHSISRVPPENLPEGVSQNANIIDAATRADGEISLVFDDHQTRRSGIFTRTGGEWIRRWGNFFTSNGLQLDYSSSGKLHMCDSQRVAYWPDHSSPSEEILRLTLQEAMSGYFTALWAPEDDRIFVGGHDGQIRRWNGTSWHSETTLQDSEIGALTGFGDHTYAISFDDGSFRDSGHLWHRSPGGAWTNITPDLDLAIKPIGFAEGRDGIYFAYATPAGFIGGDRTFLTRLSGDEVLAEVDGLSMQFDAITSNGQGDIFLLHSSGKILTNRDKPTTLSSATVPLDATSWNEINPAGIQVSPGATGTGHSFFTSWQGSGVPSRDLIPAHFTIGDEHWIINQSSLIPDDQAPTFRFRFDYAPDRLPPSFDPARVIMLRFDGTAWSAVPATFHEAEGYVETTIPTHPSTWALAIDLRDPIGPDALTITSGENGTITLSWSTDISQPLYSSPGLEPGSWEPVPESPEQIGDRFVLSLPRSAARLFFRLGE